MGFRIRMGDWGTYRFVVGHLCDFFRDEDKERVWFLSDRRVGGSSHGGRNAKSKAVGCGLWIVKESVRARARRKRRIRNPMGTHSLTPLAGARIRQPIWRIST